jgi:hypothetical protein
MLRVNIALRVPAVATLAALAMALLPVASQARPPEDLTAPVTVKNDETNPVPVTLQPGANIGVEGDVNVGGSVTVEPGGNAIPVVIEPDSAVVPTTEVLALDGRGGNVVNASIEKDATFAQLQFNVIEGEPWAVLDYVSVQSTCDTDGGAVEVRDVNIQAITGSFYVGALEKVAGEWRLGRQLGIGPFSIAEVFIEFENPAAEACIVQVSAAGRLVE